MFRSGGDSPPCGGEELLSGNGSRPLLVVITGPTASGKTDLAISLAERYGTDVVSADSRQIYRGLPIGTAAPTAEQLARVPHHFVGTLPLDAYYSAALYERDALAVLSVLWQRGPVAVVCGGSMMYVDALVRGIDDMPDVSEGTRAYVLSLLEQHGLDGLLAQLQIVDPDYYEIVDRANTRRVAHALEISLEAKVPYSTLRTGRIAERPFDVLRMMIDRPREELFARIGVRVDAMIETGLVDEARAALAQGDFNSLNTVGYKEMTAYLRGECTLAQARDKIARNTRVYAKKQLTWLAREPSVVRLSPGNAYAEAIAAIEARR